MKLVEHRLPAWLKNSRNKLTVIFRHDGSIADSNHLFDASIIDGDPKHIFSYFTADEATDLKKQLDSLKKNECFPLHFHSHEKDGRVYEWELSPYENDQVIGIAHPENIGLTHHHFSAPKKQEPRIKISQLIDSFMNHSPASAWICDAEGRLMTMNKYYLHFRGLSASDIGKTLWELFPAQFADLYHANNLLVLETGQILKTEETSIDKSGKKRYFLVYKFPVKTQGENKLVGGWSIDITELKAAEQKIGEQKMKMKELASLQSHDVRRPLANLLGLIELLRADMEQTKNTHLKNTLTYLQLSAKELDAELQKIIEKLLEEEE